MRVVVKATGDRYAGHLSIVGRSGRMSERDVEDPLCTDVVDALALVTALAVDPKATLSRPAPPPDSASAAPLAPRPDAVSPDSPAVMPALSSPPVATNAPLPNAPPPSSSVAARPSDSGLATSAPRWGVGVGATFVTMAAVAPDALAGGGGFGEIESRLPGLLAPSARLAIFAAGDGVFLKASLATFYLVAARADVCPARLGSRGVSIRACVATDVGSLVATGIVTNTTSGAGPDVTSARQAVVAWFDATALLRARWAPGHGRFFIEADGGILIPITRPNFGYDYTNPPYTLTKPKFTSQYPPKWAGPAGSLTAGLRFW